MPGPGPNFTQAQLREAVARSKTWTAVSRLLNRCPTGNGRHALVKYAALWGIDASHFDPRAAREQVNRARRIPLEEILVEHSTYSSRGKLKRRLFETGLKEPRCETCGQSKIWRGCRMSLILDHINGVRDDNRIENLRILCPNCAADADDAMRTERVYRAAMSHEQAAQELRHQAGAQFDEGVVEAFLRALDEVGEPPPA